MSSVGQHNPAGTMGRTGRSEWELDRQAGGQTGNRIRQWTWGGEAEGWTSASIGRQNVFDQHLSSWTDAVCCNTPMHLAAADADHIQRHVAAVPHPAAVAAQREGGVARRPGILEPAHAGLAVGCSVGRERQFTHHERPSRGGQASRESGQQAQISAAAPGDRWQHKRISPARRCHSQARHAWSQAGACATRPS